MNKDISPLLQTSILFLSPLVFVNPTLAQITPDGTVPTKVNQSGNVSEITGGAEKGNNLFHSFKEFSVPTGNEAFFNNASNIENIIGRVTGGSLSNIDGLIRANGSANLFLLNPAGILFGRDARLDIGGSFYGSTADSLLFDDGIEFSAVNPQNPILTINAPIGLSFRDNPASITNRSTQSVIVTDSNGNQVLEQGLSVKSNQTLALVGGDIKLEKGGILSTLTGGKIELGGLSATGTVNFNTDGSLSFPDGITRADISLIDSSILILETGKSGGISINARNLTLSALEGLASAIGAFNTTSTQQSDGALISINVSDKVSLTEQSAIIGQLAGDGVGKVKAIEINTGSLEIISSTPPGENPAQIRAFGSTENIVQDNFDILTINASEQLSINQGSIQSLVETGGIQRGNISISTGSFELTNDAIVFLNNFIPSEAVADTGKLNINADRVLVDHSTLTTGLGSTATVGTESNVEITANSVEVINNGEISANSPGGGDAGSVIIDTEQLTVRDDSEISVSSVGGGSAGELIITANSVDLDRGKLTASTEAETGGNINLTIDDSINLRNNSLISAEASGDADGGNIDIDTNLIIAIPNQNSDILASAEQGTGGRITIDAEGIFGIQVRPQNDSTNDIDATGGVDGEVIINTPDVDVTQGLVEAPQNIVEPEQTVTQACSAENISARANSMLTVTGKGGVPPEPTAPMNSHNIYIEGESVSDQTDSKDEEDGGVREDEGVLTSLSTSSPNDVAEEKEERKFVNIIERSEPFIMDEIIPARGAIVLENGDVILTAYPTPNSGYRSPHSKANCEI